MNQPKTPCTACGNLSILQEDGRCAECGISRNAGDPPRSLSKLVTVATFNEASPANLTRSFLNDHGIDATLADEHLVEMNWMLSNAVGGIKLKVPFEQEVEARALLAETSHEIMVDHTRQAEPGEDDSDDDGEDSEPVLLSDRLRAVRKPLIWLMLAPTLLGILAYLLFIAEAISTWFTRR